MTYDDQRYHTPQVWPMYKATFGEILGSSIGSTLTQTSAIVSDRIQFFKAIKLIGMKLIPETAPDATTHASSMTTKFVLTDGTTAFARGEVGTLTGVLANGSILSANIAAGKSLRLDAEVTGWDGTVNSVVPGSVWVQLEYQERFSP